MPIPSFCIRSSTFGALLFSLASISAAPDWSVWRGPQGNGHYDHESTWSHDWPATAATSTASTAPSTKKTEGISPLHQRHLRRNRLDTGRPPRLPHRLPKQTPHPHQQRLPHRRRSISKRLHPTRPSHRPRQTHLGSPRPPSRPPLHPRRRRLRHLPRSSSNTTVADAARSCPSLPRPAAGLPPPWRDPSRS